MKNFTKFLCLPILFFLGSCTHKISSTQTDGYNQSSNFSNGFTGDSHAIKSSSKSTVDSQKSILGLDGYLRNLSGVVVTGSGASAQVIVRGNRTMTTSSEPLFVLDGIAMGSYSAVYQSLNPMDIKDVSVLKDASSTSIYGARGGNGVIIITRKNINVK